MLPLLSSLILAQAVPASTPMPQENVIPQQTRPLPGRLNAVPVFNSNNQGFVWRAQVADPGSLYLAIPQLGQSFSYGLSTLLMGRMGTGQDESAKLLVRYPGTAYEAHGNYGIEYNLTLPLLNNTGEPQIVNVLFQTPIKEDKLSKPGLRFRQPPYPSVFFRGTVRIRYNDDRGLPQTKYWHLIQRAGQMGEPLAQLKMPPGTRRLVQVDFLYPPDASPPQMLTIQTVDSTRDKLRY